MTPIIVFKEEEMEYLWIPALIVMALFIIGGVIWFRDSLKMTETKKDDNDKGAK